MTDLPPSAEALTFESLTFEDWLLRYGNQPLTAEHGKALLRAHRAIVAEARSEAVRECLFDVWDEGGITDEQLHYYLRSLLPEEPKR